jgi:hypothetical protein
VLSGVLFLCGRGLEVWAIVLEADLTGVPWYLPVSTYRLSRLRRG